MESDRIRWNEKHAARNGKGDPDSFFLTHAHRLVPGKTLDLACGRGRHTAWLAAQGHHVTAVDISDVAIAHIRTLSMQTGLPIVPVQADLDLPRGLFDNDSFDNIVCINFRPGSDLLTELVRWLRPGGYFLWCSFNDLQAAMSGFPPQLVLHPHEFVYYTGLSCLVYERFEDPTGHRDGYLFQKIAAP
ncbi:MAG: class I SAM-dependent methyltransferase [Bacteroidetes bacterium]|nr:class I SAM-dependent methyltransferase [Bacteroidota bacterium]